MFMANSVYLSIQVVHEVHEIARACTTGLHDQICAGQARIKVVSKEAEAISCSDVKTDANCTASKTIFENNANGFAFKS